MYYTDCFIHIGSYCELFVYIVAYYILIQSLPIQCGNGGIALTGGSCKVRSPLSAANEPKTLINKLSKNGVIIKKIIFFGFLNVSIKFLYISKPA